MIVQSEGMPSVPESAAEGEIAEIYADYRETLGIPVVNLIWRHFAALPGALPWAWATLRPLYADGVIASEAHALRSELDLPVLPAIPAESLRAVGTRTEDIATIGRVFATYNTGNSMNLLAFLALRNALQGEEPSGGPPAVREYDRRSISGSLPHILSMDEMDADLASLVETVNTFGARDGGELMVSLYRHLAHWPGFLGLLWALLAPLQRDGKLLAATDATERDAARRARTLGSMFGRPKAEPDAAVKARIEAAIERFATNAIIKIVPIGLMVERALPEAET